nr:MAG TPA: hypothetical protein [Caudoviricetes sp.]
MKKYVIKLSKTFQSIYELLNSKLIKSRITKYRKY